LADGELAHPSCPVLVDSPADVSAVVAIASFPCVCPCECRVCRAAWWARGRPRVQGKNIDFGTPFPPPRRRGRR
jgi:hypothetical protein